jgi:hypothetical protein
MSAMKFLVNHIDQNATHEIGLGGLCKLLLSGRTNLSICS